jgi:lysophospholipase L1-like esterase
MRPLSVLLALALILPACQKGDSRPSTEEAQECLPEVTDESEGFPGYEVATPVVLVDTATEPVDTALEPDPLENCFSDISGTGADYAALSPVVGSHCQGTNHQDIQGIERVVFLGDSVTVGTPPSTEAEFYRNRLAQTLSADFGLEEPDWWWEAVNIVDGTTYVQDSGDFSSCASWGARADDLMQDNAQVLDCFPESERHKKTLVIMTVGGNDLAKLTQGFIEGESVESLWEDTVGFMGLVREAVTWFVEDPARFPNGVFVVFTNLYEFTDATGDTSSCPVAELAGFGEAVTDPGLEEMVIWSMEEFMSIAVDTGTDMLFLLENFCGHGFHYDDPASRCYRGPEAEIWFDLTCIHPNPTGHAAIADMVMAVVRE